MYFRIVIFIVFGYIAFKFFTKIAWPILKTILAVRKQLKQQQANNNVTENESGKTPTSNQIKVTSEYIDFEEVK
jgi:hypothetical protein